MIRPMLIIVVAAIVVACSAPTTSAGSPAVTITATVAPVPSSVATISPDPSIAAAASPSPIASLSLDRTFTSPLYGYAIGVAPGWMSKPATLLADDPRSTDETANDVITVTGTDTEIYGIAWNLGTQTFEAWLKDYRASMSSSVPAGCDGGDPATWPAVAIGALQGVWQQKCNAAVANVESGGKAYQFAWENNTFDDTQHLPVAAFKTLLETVKFLKPAGSASPAP